MYVIIIVIILLVIIFCSDKGSKPSNKINPTTNPDSLNKNITNTRIIEKVNPVPPLKIVAPPQIIKSVKSYSYEEKRIKSQNAYKKWSTVEDEKLKNLFLQNKSIPEIARLLGRSSNAISRRIEKIKCEKNTSNLSYVKPKYDFSLFHFTDPRNLPSIKKYGLLSWQELVNKKIHHYPASNELSRSLDRRYNLEDYVRLSLNKKHPMFSAAIYYGRVQQLVWLKINPDIIDFKDTLFSNDNATCNNVTISNNKFTALRSTSPQAEVLVKHCVDPKYITFPEDDIINNLTITTKNNSSISNSKSIK